MTYKTMFLLMFFYILGMISFGLFGHSLGHKSGLEEGASTTVLQVECEPQEPSVNAAPAGSHVKWVF